MPKEFIAQSLDVMAFAQASGLLKGESDLAAFARLAGECAAPPADHSVRWQARGELISQSGGQAQAWIHLQAWARLPLICQRCLGPVEAALMVDRKFRFVATERQAEAEDEEAEEEVLALSTHFDLLALVEDELLMEVPLVPRHNTCPAPLKLTAQDADFELAQVSRPKPFAVLAKLKSGKSS